VELLHTKSGRVERAIIASQSAFEIASALKCTVILINTHDGARAGRVEDAVLLVASDTLSPLLSGRVYTITADGETRAT